MSWLLSLLSGLWGKLAIAGIAVGGFLLWLVGVKRKARQEGRDEVRRENEEQRRAAAQSRREIEDEVASRSDDAVRDSLRRWSPGRDD